MLLLIFIIFFIDFQRNMLETIQGCVWLRAGLHEQDMDLHSLSAPELAPIGVRIERDKVLAAQSAISSNEINMCSACLSFKFMFQ